MPPPPDSPAGEAAVPKGGLDELGDTADWNTLPSELKDQLLQKRGNTPPPKYQKAIEKYFETIGAEP